MSAPVLKFLLSVAVLHLLLASSPIEASTGTAPTGTGPTSTAPSATGPTVTSTQGNSNSPNTATDPARNTGSTDTAAPPKICYQCDSSASNQSTCFQSGSGFDTSIPTVSCPSGWCTTRALYNSTSSDLVFLENVQRNCSAAQKTNHCLMEGDMHACYSYCSKDFCNTDLPVDPTGGSTGGSRRTMPDALIWQGVLLQLAVAFCSLSSWLSAAAA
jgi:hypothetical protein